MRNRGYCKRSSPDLYFAVYPSSGHNHGGVIRIPFYGGLIPPARKTGEYDAGLFYRNGSALLVSPGLAGTNGIPRFLNRPQLCLAILRQWPEEE